MLSDQHHYFSIADMTERCNEKLEDAGLPTVTRRCIEKDILYLEYEPFNADIERYRVNGKNCLRYANPSFSIFQKEMSDEERHLLNEVLSTLGQFEGLAHFEWLDKFKIGLGLDDRRQIISFSNNPYLKNSNLLGTLFDNIANEEVVRITYHKFVAPKGSEIICHPYQLKQYNERWFLLAAADSDKKMLTLPLDRIEKVEPLPEMKYAACPEHFSERFEDIVGVTLFDDEELQHILFWVSDVSKGHVITKPIHGSQVQYRGEKEQELRRQYPDFEGGAFFSIDCIKNFELLRVLTSYGKELIVLHSDGDVLDEVYERISEMKEKYSELRTYSSRTRIIFTS